MKKIFIILFLFIFNNTYANNSTYSLDQTNKELNIIVEKSSNTISKHISKGGVCDVEGVKNDILNKMFVSTYQLQKKIDDKYKLYNEQLKNNSEKLKILYTEYDKLKLAYEKADNLHKDYYHNTGDYNYDLLRDSNYAYDLKGRKEKEIADFMKNDTKYIEDFDKSDIDFYINSNIESKYVTLVTDYCLEIKNKSEIKTSTQNKTVKTEIKQNNTKTKLQIKQDELKVKINTIYKKSPKSIQKLLPQITKLKKKTKAGTDTYVLLETIETEINLLQNQK